MKPVQYVRIGPDRTQEKVVAGRRRWKIGTSQAVQYGRIGGDTVVGGRIEETGGRPSMGGFAGVGGGAGRSEPQLSFAPTRHHSDSVVPLVRSRPHQ